MSQSPPFHGFHHQYNYESLHDHFATYTQDPPAAKSRLTRAQTEPTFNFTRQDTLYDHFSLNTYIEFPATKLKSTFPSPSASTLEVREWIQSLFTSRQIFVSNKIINEIPWNGADLRGLDVRVQGCAVLDLVRWGVEVEDARMICEEIEGQRIKVKRNTWGKICHGLLHTAAFVAAVVIVSCTYVRYQKAFKI